MRAALILLALTLGGCGAQTYGIGSLLQRAAADPVEEEARRDVPFVPTPEPVVAAMLDLARVGPGDVLIDLGSGDGRIAIQAARRGARAQGVDIDPVLVTRANARAAEAGVADRATFRTGDLFELRLREASVVSMYLLPAINMRLRPRLLTELAAGTRVVSHAFDMGDWPPDEQRMVDGRQVYLWTVPATAGGDWRVRLADGSERTLHIDQRFQRVTGTLGGRPLTNATLRGRSLGFTVATRNYRALVGDAAISIDPAASGSTISFSGRRVE